MSDDNNEDDKEYFAGITPEQKAEIDALFNNEELMRYMSGLAYDGPPSCAAPRAPKEVRLKRMEEALNAFMENPPQWWDDMNHNG